MTITLDKVEQEMLKELMKNGAVVGKRYTDQKAFVKELIKRLYLNL